MNRIVLVLLGVIAALGLADAWYLAQSAITGSSLACSITGLDGCNIVAKSAYSHFLGVPLSVYGIGFYAVMLAVLAWIYGSPKRSAYATFLAVSGLGLVASVYFEFLQVFLIKAVCIYCAGSFLASLLLFAGSLYLWRQPAAVLPQRPAVLP